MKNLVSRVVVLLCVLVIVLSACAPKTEPATNSEVKGTIAISGAFALYPMMTRWAEEFQKVYPDVQFDISAGGAGKGMTDAITGAVEIGMVSRDVSPEEEAQGAYYVPVVIDAVFPVVNEKNPVLSKILEKPITQEIFKKIFITGEITTWGEVVGDTAIKDEIHVFTRSDACGAADVWSKYLGGKQENLLGVGVNADPGLLDAVINDPLGIGYNNLNYAFDITTGKPASGAIVVPIDVNNNGVSDSGEYLLTNVEAIEAIKNGKYPSPPARQLNIVTKGKATGLTQIFINWILTEGQKFVSEAGYIELTKDQLEAAIKKNK
jgi:phosphate transport system substrate-binding protein